MSHRDKFETVDEFIEKLKKYINYGNNERIALN